MDITVDDVELRSLARPYVQNIRHDGRRIVGNSLSGQRLVYDQVTNAFLSEDAVASPRRRVSNEPDNRA